jgi:DNA-binding NarL/FixJ family response regulator
MGSRCSPPDNVLLLVHDDRSDVSLRHFELWEAEYAMCASRSQAAPRIAACPPATGASAWASGKYPETRSRQAVTDIRDLGPELQAVWVAADVHRDIGFEAMDGNVPDRPDLSREANEFLRLMADGMSTRQIAQELKISERSAQVLIPKILRKLGRGPDDIASPRTRQEVVQTASTGSLPRVRRNLPRPGSHDL